MTIFLIVAEKHREGIGRGQGQNISFKGIHTLSDLLSPSRPHLPMFLPHPKIVPPAGDQHTSLWGISYLNHTIILQFSRQALYLQATSSALLQFSLTAFSKL
jgi:hypothetical protein